MSEPTPDAATITATGRVELRCIVEACGHHVVARSSDAAVEAFKDHLFGPPHADPRGVDVPADRELTPDEASRALEQAFGNVRARVTQKP